METESYVWIELWVALVGLAGLLVQSIVGPLLTLWFNRKIGAKRKTLSGDVSAAMAKYLEPVVQRMDKLDERQVKMMKHMKIYVPSGTQTGVPALTPEERSRGAAFAEETTPVDRNRK